MNHYFSRLAQRSSIVAPDPVRQSQAVNAHTSHVDSANADATNTNRAANRETNHENSIDAWGEQNTEINSSGYYSETKLEKSDNAARTPGNQDPIDQSSIAPRVNTQVASTTPGNAGINTTQVTASGLQSGLTQPQSLSTGVHFDAVDALTNVSTNSLSTIDYSEHQNAQPLSGLSAAGKVVATLQREFDNFSDNDIFTEQRQNIPASAQPHRKTIVVESVQRHSNTIALDNSNTQGFYDRSVIEENQNIKTTARPDSEVQSTSLFASAHRAGRAASNSVAALPTEIPSALINRPDAAPRSGVQVNIGKIELEIFAPQKKVVQAPPPAAPVVKPARREPVFNPHRHYLRSR